MTFRVAHWDASNDSLHSNMFGEDFIEQLMTNVTCLYFSMKEEDILEHTNDKCHMFTF
jgi:hypothetical protein